MLFLKAMCVVNTGSSPGGEERFGRGNRSRPGKEILQVTSDILASLAVGEKPVRYSEAEMAQVRSLQANRNWQFDEESTGWS